MLDVSMQSYSRQIEEGKSFEQNKRRLSLTAADSNKFVVPF
jgi:hypothetical protein